jgi:hypothetical protein
MTQNKQKWLAVVNTLTNVHKILRISRLAAKIMFFEANRVEIRSIL